MARTINRLSHRKVETLKKPGMYSRRGWPLLAGHTKLRRYPAKVLAF